jgi:hypothetical protein
MYRLIDRNGLQSFICESTSTRALADRADVDIDRLSALLPGAFRNPIEFWVSCMQYAVSLQRELWGKVAAVPDSAPVRRLGEKSPRRS